VAISTIAVRRSAASMRFAAMRGKLSDYLLTVKSGSAKTVIIPAPAARKNRTSKPTRRRAIVFTHEAP
jgi:hypothetical protein